MTARREYPAAILEVIDGDTLVVTADLGFDVWYRVHVRLLGINAREKTDPGGPEARAHLAGLLSPGLRVLLQSDRWDKYGGRALGYVHLSDGRDVAEVMADDGYAARWDGRGSRPVPPWPITTRAS